MSNHKHAPVNRREFLSQLVTGYAAMSFMPNVLSWLLTHQAAQAEETNPLLPFMVFDLAGGSALPGNFLVGKQAPEDLLASYDTLGWDPREADSLDKRFGLPMSKKFSKVLQGITSTASANAMAGLRFSSLLHFSQDDSNLNPLSAIAMVTRSGLRGSAVQEPLGTVPSRSGGNSPAALADLGTAAVTVNNLQTLIDSAGFIGSLQKLKPELVRKMSANAMKLNAEQMKRLSSLGGAEQLSALQGGFFAKNATAAGASPLDPRANASAQQAYGIGSDTAINDRKAIFSGISLGTITGVTGPGVLSIGGCDYHDGTQTSGDAKDFEIGQEIGRAVELAYRLQKPLFMQIFTDGGIVAKVGTRNWNGDSGVRSMTVIGVYDPTNMVKIKQKNLQIGRYTDGQIADQTTLIGRESNKVATAVFANYLSVCGRMDLYSKVLSGIAPLSQADAMSTLCFERV